LRLDYSAAWPRPCAISSCAGWRGRSLA